MPTNGPLVHFAGSSIRVCTEHAGLLAAIGTHFKHCLGEGGRVVAEYALTSADGANFSFGRDGAVLYSDMHFEQVLGYLMQDGLTQLNGASRTHLVFHAAAAARRQQGVVLFGRSGCGKSTLAARLLRGGFEYLSDEVVALPTQGGEISGLSRSLALKQGSRFIWEPLLPPADPHDLLLFSDGSAWIVPSLLTSLPVPAAVKPGLLVFVKYEAGARFRSERLTSASSLFLMMQCLVNARNFSDGGLGAAAGLARAAPAFSLTYSDVESAGEWIQSRIDAG